MNMQTYKLVLACGTLVLFGASVTAHAGSKDDKAMDVCIEAFVSEQVPLNHPLKIRKVDTSGRDSLSRWNFPQRSTVEVTAKGARTGKVYGAATCVVDRRGELVAMRIDSDHVRMASRDARSEPQG